jgi:two-component system response regulator YesN
MVDMAEVDDSLDKQVKLGKSGASGTGGIELLEIIKKNRGHYSMLVRKVLDYIDDYYTEWASIKDFSQAANTNMAYTGHLFKQETGLFFNSYLTYYRVRKAMRLLTESHEKISDIATRTGFASTSYFISSFKRIVGVSPAKYRLKEF